MDFGANKTLTGGLALQTVDTYKEFIGRNDVSFGGNNFEIYFEEDDFDKFVNKLKECDIEYVHPVIEHSWGQRVVRFYDPDRHIIEVGENMKNVCRRFLENGMTAEQVGNDVSFGGNNFEIYFEEDDFDKFVNKLKECDIEYVHPVIEHSWGQRVVRFYDPDRHIIEVGENMKNVCRRFLENGMTAEQVAKRMDVPIKFVNACMR